MLIAAGADVNAVDKIGRTPLHYACNEGYESIVRALVAAGAKVDVKDNEGRTPADIATERGFKGILAVLKGGAAVAKPAQKEAAPTAVAGTGKLGNELRAAAGAGDLAR